MTSEEKLQFIESELRFLIKKDQEQLLILVDNSCGKSCIKESSDGTRVILGDNAPEDLINKMYNFVKSKLN